MLKHVQTALTLTTALALLLGLAVTPAAGQNDVALERIEAHATNRPLGSLQAEAARARAAAFRPGPPREVVNFRGEPTMPADVGAAESDGLTIQQVTGAGTSSVLTGFPGTDNNENGNVFGFLIAPPDTDGHVGPSHYVQMINLLTTIFDKSGNIVTAPFPSNAFWAGIGGNCEAFNQGDPVVLYDEVAGRWLVSQFAFPDAFDSFSQCVAISQTSDPTGGYNRYELSFDGIGFNDYPKHGIVSDSITIMANLFVPRGPFLNFSGTFLGVMDKNAMYAGAPASLVGFNLGTGEFGFIAGDLDGTGSAPALFATAMSTANAFDIWQIDIDWATENGSVNQVASIPISPFDANFCSASRGACIPQPEGGPALETFSDRLMHRLQIRDFGAYKTMVTAHSVDVGNGRAGIRWYEMRDSGSGWGLYQEGTFAPNDGENRWMPSAAMNAAGDIGIGYMLASENTFVSTAVAGQSAAASGTGTLDSDEVICAAGSGVQLEVNRAGDYSSTSVDPVTDTFWHTNEVFTTTGQFQWDTFVCEFSIEGGPINNAPAVTITSPADGSSVDSGVSISFSGTATDTEDGDLTGSLSWSSDLDGVIGLGGSFSTVLSDGSHTITASVTDSGGASGSDSISVTVGGGSCLPLGASCSSNGDCCSNKCKGKSGSQTCK